MNHSKYASMSGPSLAIVAIHELIGHPVREIHTLSLKQGKRSTVSYEAQLTCMVYYSQNKGDS